ncbi:hypothetical protein MIN45_PP24 (plasmid) [Methylomarinovum tepidoasis]|uniref:Toxin-antitoxin system HicB family antitoxin n=1 Tax=Methylomarinovum tepidoasis TaxID=2840183 RepID=A0AAU9CZ71_9GAMM|nr:toxin-antitoxin system HicB family antitoxin [Methylomarinovum sp. IN45]BCX90010.1 hypothetical protein MIN45_PP24 [Methylomarinovum sp. IN45]
MKKSNFALRMMPSLMRELKAVAKEEGVSINQLVNLAVAEKLAVLKSARAFFAERAHGRDKDSEAALAILGRFGEDIDEAQALAELKER